MTDKEKANAIRGKYMTMSYSIEPDGSAFPMNYKLYVERLEVLLFDAEQQVLNDNDLARSLFSIIVRKGKNTNWDKIRDRVDDVLNKQYKFLKR